MAEVLLDSSIFGRYLNPDDAGHDLTRKAIRTLVEQDHVLCFVPQIAYELHSFMTRSRGEGKDLNGFGWSVARAASWLDQIERRFRLRFPDPRAEYEIFRDLVCDLEVKGRKVHDLRLVASARALGIRKLLTLNATDCKRAADANHIELLTPADVIQGMR